MNVPVLYIVYNRPGVVENSFKTLARVKPQNLFIAADGPKSETDLELCNQTRSYILDSIDWECRVETLFQESNLGCQKAIGAAIDWFFEHVEEGIILEDDIEPHEGFFDFAGQLLAHYREDLRVFSIGGFNPLNCSDFKQKGDYLFSKTIFCAWGWATWKNRWNEVDVSFADWPAIKANFSMAELYNHEAIGEKNFNLFELVYNGEIDTWDYQVALHMVLSNQTAIIPRFNLIQNIGFGEEATHTKSKDHPVNGIEFVKKIDKKLQHPDYLVPSKTFDLKYQEFFSPALFKKRKWSIKNIQFKVAKWN